MTTDATPTIESSRAQLLRLAGYVAANQERLAAATTDDERRNATRALRTTTGMLDVGVIELALLLAEGDAEVSRKMRTALARALRAITSDARADASRRNGAAPVREGNRRRGRPSKVQSE